MCHTKQIMVHVCTLIQNYSLWSVPPQNMSCATSVTCGAQRNTDLDQDCQFTDEKYETQKAKRSVLHSSYQTGMKPQAF